jgi:BASS family bile acid:Na+ symporter
MIEAFKSLLAVSVLVFPVASMLSVGLGYTLCEIAGPFRHPERIFRALVANFVLVPLLAFGIARLLSLEPAFTTGLMLIGTAAGAPFLIKLTRAANADPALSATMVVLLMPLTVVYMPLVIPLVVADASVRAIAIAAPLLATLILPLILGLVLDSTLPRWAARLQPVAMKTSSIALLVLVTSTVVVNAPLLARLLGTGAIAAAFLLIAGAFCVGYLIASPGGGRRTVMGLGTAQRNIAAAMVVAKDFDDPNILVMVVVVSVIDLVVLFPIAWVLRRRSTGGATRAKREGAGASALPASPQWEMGERDGARPR